MGQEIKCNVDFGKESSHGRALLETSEIIFRGGFRLKIPCKSITSLEAGGGKLKIAFPEGLAVFHAGDKAEKWAERIRNPPSRLDKLGVKPGFKVRLIGKHDDDFRSELAERGAITTKSKPDLVFLSIKTKDELVELAYLADAPVWIGDPKGMQAVTGNDVIAAGRAAGFAHAKVCPFYATPPALKFKPRPN